jgi:Protein of unknown function (DUF998)
MHHDDLSTSRLSGLSVQEGVCIMSNVKRSALTEFLLLCGVIGPVLFWVVLMVEGVTRPGYIAWQAQGSYLSLTNQGWEQITNFLVFGVLCIAYAIGLRRTWPTGRASLWGPLLIGLFGVGMLALGVFVTDPGDGYPPGTPLQTSPTTWHGLTHGLTGLVTVNIVLPAACFVLSRRWLADPDHRRWGTYAWLTGALILIISVPATVGLPFAYRAGFPIIDGLVQRIIITLGWAWLALTALHLWRQARQERSEEASTSNTGTSANAG